MNPLFSIEKVFLLADIGNGKNNSYHVGDEAMFLQNLRKYQSLGIKVSASSRSINHKDLGFNEVLDIYIMNIPALLWFVLCSYIFRYFRLNLFPKRFRKTVEELVSSNMLHVSGGGNLNSFWPGHIYYRFLMITLADIFNKEIILTSQTIGLLKSTFHKFLLGLCLKKVNVIEVRDQAYSRRVLLNLGISDTKILNVIDDAYEYNFGPTLSRNIKKIIFDRFPDVKNKLRIGISMHRWPSITDFGTIKKIFEKLIQNYPNAYFFIIPHHFDDKNGLDLDFMTRLFDKNMKHVGFFDYKALIAIANKTKSTPADIIRVATANMDVVISSRYHGLVFALSSSVPALAINYDRYYSLKNKGLLSNFFNDSKTYIVPVNEIERVLDKTEKIIKNREKIVSELKFINKKLAKKYEDKFD